jgi:hypothetical protein
MKVKITFNVPHSDPVITHVEVAQNGDESKAIHDALDLARKQNPNCSIFDSNIKLESRQ